MKTYEKSECTVPTEHERKPLTCEAWKVHVWSHEDAWKRKYPYRTLRDFMTDALGL